MAIACSTVVIAGWRPFAAGAAVGLLGGLIGLGGAEFRLPLLLMFGLAVLPAVIVNKAISLVVVASALVFRSHAVSPVDVAAQWPVIVNLLLGSLAGAWLAAGWATRWKGPTLQRVIALLLLLLIAVALLLEHGPGASSAALQGVALWVAGVAAGFAIGVVASLPARCWVRQWAVSCWGRYLRQFCYPPWPPSWQFQA